MAPENSCWRGVDGKAIMISDGLGFSAIYTRGNSPNKEHVLGEQIIVGQLIKL